VAPKAAGALAHMVAGACTVVLADSAALGCGVERAEAAGVDTQEWDADRAEALECIEVSQCTAALIGTGECTAALVGVLECSGTSAVANLRSATLVAAVVADLAIVRVVTGRWVANNAGVPADRVAGDLPSAIEVAPGLTGTGSHANSAAATTGVLKSSKGRFRTCRRPSKSFQKSTKPDGTCLREGKPPTLRSTGSNSFEPGASIFRSFEL
jgi:hypothetical protein